ncbi:hypothetical protein IAU60_006229 [Kwoniella sp. DSM 27419]
MPTFYPPLAHTSEVHVTSSADHPYFQLRFSAVFADGEDASGSWEIWTDLPHLDEQGNLSSASAEWRAVALVAASTKTGSLVAHANGHSDDTAHQKASDSVTTVADPTSLSHFAIIKTTAGSEYSYTYRHITSSGETHWLGGMGGNGFIKLVEGSGAAESTGEQSGSWLERLPEIETLRWYGVGIEWTGSKGCERPFIRTLPAKDASSPFVSLLQAHRPAHLGPFAQPLNAPTVRATLGSEHSLAIIATVDGEIQIPASSSLPTCSNSAYGFTHDETARQALSAAFRAAHTKQKRVETVEVELDGTSDSGVVGLIARKDNDSGEKTYLVIYTPPTSASRQVSITIPKSIAESSPLAVLSEQSASASFVEASKDRKVQLHLETGRVGHILQIAEFVELRGAGNADSIWICAPFAIDSQIGEEEVDRLKPSASLTSDLPVQQAEVVEPVAVSGSQGVAHAVQEDVVEPENQLPGSFVPPSKGDVSTDTDESATSGWWLFRLIGHFFADIWALVMGPFRSQLTVKTSSNTGEDHSDTQVPPDERTPLLGSTAMSRETSSSSTAIDSLASPSSITTTVKGELDAKPGVFNATTPIGSAPQQVPFFNRSEAPLANSVTVRSYAQMSFNHLPPFKFYFPPNAQAEPDRLRFLLKNKLSEEWKEVKPAIVNESKDDGECIQVVVSPDYKVDAPNWEVQVERV